MILTLEVFFPKETGMTKDALEHHLEDLQCVGVFKREVVEKGDGWFRCTFNQKEWDESRESTGCADELSDAQQFEEELQGQFIFTENILQQIKVVEIKTAEDICRIVEDAVMRFQIEQLNIAQLEKIKKQEWVRRDGTK